MVWLLYGLLFDFDSLTSINSLSLKTLESNPTSKKLIVIIIMSTSSMNRYTFF
jgi:hypothetical protein